jgi:hypothetical protein
LAIISVFGRAIFELYIARKQGLTSASRNSAMRSNFGKLLLQGLALGLALLPTHLFAATVTWVGGSGDWNTAGAGQDCYLFDLSLVFCLNMSNC